MGDTRDRLARYLDDALAVERALVTSLDDMAWDVDDATLKALFEDHCRVTERQAQALEARIRALGHEPSGTKSGLGRAACDLLHFPEDHLDVPTQHLMREFTSENFEMAMYHALRSYAEAVGDSETAALAQRHSLEEKAMADRIWPLIAEFARKPAQLARADR